MLIMINDMFINKNLRFSQISGFSLMEMKQTKN